MPIMSNAARARGERFGSRPHGLNMDMDPLAVTIGMTNPSRAPKSRPSSMMRAALREIFRARTSFHVNGVIRSRSARITGSLATRFSRA